MFMCLAFFRLFLRYVFLYLCRYVCISLFCSFMVRVVWCVSLFACVVIYVLISVVRYSFRPVVR